MTGVEWILLLIGSIFMIGSFFITEKLSPSELNKIAELSESEIKKIIDRGLESAKNRIEYAIDNQIEESTDKVDRALEKETNEKIMAISEYSDTVLESMNKTHNEIMFLYSMLNDKHTELTEMTSNLQRLAADVRSLEENMPRILEQPVMQQQVVVSEQPVMPTEEQGMAVAAETEDENVEVSSQPPAGQNEKDNSNREILALYKEGLTEIQIARKLKMGIGEVRLVIGLYRGEKDS